MEGLGLRFSKQGMKRKNRNMIILAACGLLVAAGAGASVAYLTDGETTTNVFTFGKVQADLSEPHYVPQNGVPRVPNEEIAKDPTVTNTGDNDAIMFLSFDIPVADVVVADYDGTIAPSIRPKTADPNVVELFQFRSSAGTYSSVNEGWVEISSTLVDEDGDDIYDYKAYLFGYNKVSKAKRTGTEVAGAPGEDGYVAAEESVDANPIPPVFDYIRMANVVEGQLERNKLEIPVRLYAIQFDFLQSSDNSELNHNISTDAPMSAETLTEIFSIYANQNNTVQDNGALAAWSGLHSDNAKTAGSNNSLDLMGETKEEESSSEADSEEASAPESADESNEEDKSV